MTDPINETGRVSITAGIANAMVTYGGARQCPECNFVVPKYPGRYPRGCPRCGEEMVGCKQESVTESMGAGKAIRALSRKLLDVKDDVTLLPDGPVKRDLISTMRVVTNHLKRLRVKVKRGIVAELVRSLQRMIPLLIKAGIDHKPLVEPGKALSGLIESRRGDMTLNEAHTNLMSALDEYTPSKRATPEEKRILKAIDLVRAAMMRDGEFSPGHWSALLELKAALRNIETIERRQQSDRWQRASFAAAMGEAIEAVFAFSNLNEATADDIAQQEKEYAKILQWIKYAARVQPEFAAELDAVRKTMDDMIRSSYTKSGRASQELVSAFRKGPARKLFDLARRAEGTRAARSLNNAATFADNMIGLLLRYDDDMDESVLDEGLLDRAAARLFQAMQKRANTLGGVVAQMRVVAKQIESVARPPNTGPMRMAASVARDAKSAVQSAAREANESWEPTEPTQEVNEGVILTILSAPGVFLGFIGTIIFLLKSLAWLFGKMGFERLSELCKRGKDSLEGIEEATIDWLIPAELSYKVYKILWARGWRITTFAGEKLSKRSKYSERDAPIPWDYYLIREDYQRRVEVTGFKVVAYTLALWGIHQIITAPMPKMLAYAAKHIPAVGLGLGQMADDTADIVIRTASVARAFGESIDEAQVDVPNDFKRPAGWGFAPRNLTNAAFDAGRKARRSAGGAAGQREADAAYRKRYRDDDPDISDAFYDGWNSEDFNIQHQTEAVRIPPVCGSRAVRIQSLIETGTQSFAPFSPHCSNVVTVRYAKLIEAHGSVDTFRTFLEGPTNGHHYRIEERADPVLIFEFNDDTQRMRVFATNAPTRYLDFDPRADVVVEDHAVTFEDFESVNPDNVRMIDLGESFDISAKHATELQVFVTEADARMTATELGLGLTPTRRSIVGNMMWVLEHETTGYLLAHGEASRLIAETGYDSVTYGPEQMRTYNRALDRMHDRVAGTFAEDKRASRNRARKPGERSVVRGGMRISTNTDGPDKPRKDISQSLQNKVNANAPGALRKRIKGLKKFHRTAAGREQQRTLGTHRRLGGGESHDAALRNKVTDVMDRIARYSSASVMESAFVAVSGIVKPEPGEKPMQWVMTQWGKTTGETKMMKPTEALNANFGWSGSSFKWVPTERIDSRGQVILGSTPEETRAYQNAQRQAGLREDNGSNAIGGDQMAPLGPQSMRDKTAGDHLEAIIRRLIVTTNVDVLQDVEFDDETGSIYLFFDPVLYSDEVQEILSAIVQEVSSVQLIASPDRSLPGEAVESDWWVMFMPGPGEVAAPDASYYAARPEDYATKVQAVVMVPSNEPEALAQGIDVSAMLKAAGS